MPREIVEIPIFKATPPFEAPSYLLSYMAYPEDNKRRKIFEAALCKYAHYKKCLVDKAWCTSVQLVRPYIFVYDDKVFRKSMADGADLIARRIITATALLGPHILSLWKSCPPPKIRGFAPTLNNISLDLLPVIGWHTKEGNNSTFKAKIWGPTKPVAHLAFAFMYSFFEPLERHRSKQDKNYHSDGVPIEIDKCFLLSQEDLFRILMMAEEVRQSLPNVKQYRFKESDTIRFEPI